MRLSILILLLCASPAFCWQDRYESMVQRSLNRDIADAKAASLKAELLSEAPRTGELELWKSLWEGSSRERASRGIALIEVMYPGGDLSRWEDVRGLIHPSLMPRPLMAVDALLVTVKSLVDVEGGAPLAASLLSSFGSCSRAKHVFLASLPVEMSSTLSYLVEAEDIPGFWVPSDLVGKLPLAAPIRGNISQSSAISGGMQFLDRLGVPSSNGPYCWDRSSGRIYRIVDGTDPLLIRSF